MKKVTLTALGAICSLFGCGDSGAEDGQRKDLDTNPKAHYWPSFANNAYWRKSPEFKGWTLFPAGIKEFSEADRAAADDLTRYHERVWETWTQTLHHGFVPKAYLARPGIEYNDETNGQIPGMEKLKPVVSRIQSRCRAFLPGESGLSIKTQWLDPDSPQGRFFLQKGRAWGTFMTGAQTALQVADFRKKPYEKALGLTTVVMPENFINVLGGKHALENTMLDYGFYPKLGVWKQTHADFYGAPPWEDPTLPKEEWQRRDELNFDPELDRVFAHELGHAYFFEWALKNGRSTVATRKFHEMFAEMFENLCYSSVKPSKVQKARAFFYSVSVKETSIDSDGNAKIKGRPFKKQDCGEKINCTALDHYARESKSGFQLKNEAVDKNRIFTWEGQLLPYNYMLPFYTQIESDMRARGLWSEETPKTIFSAIIKTLEDMKGVRLPKCAPKTAIKSGIWRDPMSEIEVTETVEHEFASDCPWGALESDLNLPFEERPLAFTQREFMELFQKNYPYADHLKEGYQSQVDFFNTVWEY